MALFTVVVFPSEQKDDILHRLHNPDPAPPRDPYQIIPQVLYLIESDLGTLEISRQLGLDHPAPIDPPARVAKLSEDDIAWIGKFRG